MSTRRFDATAAEVRRALDGVYEELDPGDALWRCTAGPFRTPVEVRIDDGPVVVASATVVPAPALTGAVARAILFEHDSLMFGRFVHADGEIRAEQRILGGHTMDGQEVRLAVWGVGWAAGAYRDRWQRHLAGEAVLVGDPVAGVAARRGAERPRRLHPVARRALPARALRQLHVRRGLGIPRPVRLDPGVRVRPPRAGDDRRWC